MLATSVSDKQLVHQTLHGHPKSYGTVASLISFQMPQPSFFQTRSLLQMEETCLHEPEPETTVLWAAPPSHTSRGNSTGGRGRNGNRGRGLGQSYPPSQHSGFNYYHH